MDSCNGERSAPGASAGWRQGALAFDDWMFLQPDDVLINQVTMAKFGVTVGQLVWTAPLG
jgi:hypothetical protein